VAILVVVTTDLTLKSRKHSSRSIADRVVPLFRSHPVCETVNKKAGGGVITIYESQTSSDALVCRTSTSLMVASVS